MRTRLTAALLVAAALSFAPAAHAYPESTLCNNEPSDTWVALDPHNGVGVDRFQPNGDITLCVRTGLTGDPYQIVVLRPNGGPTTVCTHYSDDAVWNDTCFYLPGLP